MSHGGTLLILPEYVQQHARDRGDAIALTDGQNSRSLRDLADAMNRVAAALAGMGVQTGNHVCLLSGNSLWAYEVMLGIWRAGAVYTPLSPMLTADMLATQIADCGANILWVGQGCEDLAQSVAALRPMNLIHQGDALAAGGNPAGPARDDLATLIYSSGTTGTPKGILHSHAARLNMASSLEQCLHVDPQSCAIVATPPFTNGTMICLLPILLAGGRARLMKKFSVAEFCDIVRHERPSHVFLVPTLLRQLIHDPAFSSLDLSCFKAVISAGAPLAETLKQDLLAAFGTAFSELWGLTEGVASFISGVEMKQRITSVGRPLSGSELRLIDAEGREITDGVGEIVGRSTYLMSGYLNRQAETRAMEWRDDQGHIFLKTGDLGEIDGDGYLTLKGRLKDMIISGGINVYPQDLELLLMQHSDVVDAAVVGQADDKWGEVPVAHVLVKSGSPARAEDIRQWANSHLAKHQRLAGVVLRSTDFPRNALGKIVKSALKDQTP